MAGHWTEGGKVAAAVARAVVNVVEGGNSKMKLLIPTRCRSWRRSAPSPKIDRAKNIAAAKSVRNQLASFEAMGFGKVPTASPRRSTAFHQPVRRLVLRILQYSLELC